MSAPAEGELEFAWEFLALPNDHLLDAQPADEGRAQGLQTPRAESRSELTGPGSLATHTSLARRLLVAGKREPAITQTEKAMTTSSSPFKRRSLAVLELIGVVLLSSYSIASHAILQMTLQERGNDVVLTASGTLNLTALTIDPELRAVTGLNPNGFPIGPTAVAGPPAGLGGPFRDAYHGAINGPESFGSGSFSFPTGGSGGPAGIGTSTGFGAAVLVPLDYQSGETLTGSSTFANSTLKSLGVRTGTYTWTWGRGADQDSIVLQIGRAAGR